MVITLENFKETLQLISIAIAIIILLCGPLFTMYINRFKYGKDKIGAHYDWTCYNGLAEGIGNVTILNMKDKPLIIFEMYALDRGVIINLKKFNPPLIVKGLESISIPIRPVSARYVNNQSFIWELPAGEPTNFDIIVSTQKRIITCKRWSPKSVIYNKVIKKGLKLAENHSNNMHIDSVLTSVDQLKGREN